MMMSEPTMKQKVQGFRDLVLGKQDELTAGTNITIDNNVISAAETGGASSWTDLTEKPFSSIDSTTLKVESNALKVNTTDNAEQDNTKPITSSGVYTLLGNINVLLSHI